MTGPVHELTRRGLLRLDTAGPLGLTLGGLWRAQAAAPPAPTGGKPARACILVFYYGGPSHLDTWDLKPNAPAEVRGEFKPIATAVPGLQVCEHLPRLARVMDRVALVRGVTHAARLHDPAAIHALTGRPLDGPDRELFAPQPQFYPSHGSAVAYMTRGAGAAVPFAALPFPFRNVHEVPCQGGWFLGSAYDPVRVDGDPAARRYRAETLSRPADVARDRRDLLRALDPAAGGGPADRAYRLIESDAVRRALDLSGEPAAVRDRCGFDADRRRSGPAGAGGTGRRWGTPASSAGRTCCWPAGWWARGAVRHRVRLRAAGAELGRPLPVRRPAPPAPAPPSRPRAVGPDRGPGTAWAARFHPGGGDGGVRADPEDQRGRRPGPLAGLLHGAARRRRGVWRGGVRGQRPHRGVPGGRPGDPGDLAATIFWRFGLDPAAEVRDPTGRPHRLAAEEPVRKLFV